MIDAGIKARLLIKLQCHKIFDIKMILFFFFAFCHFHKIQIKVSGRLGGSRICMSNMTDLEFLFYSEALLLSRTP